MGENTLVAVHQADDNMILNLTFSGDRRNLIAFLEQVSQAKGVAVVTGSFTTRESSKPQSSKHMA